MGTSVNQLVAIKKLEALFNDAKIDNKPNPEIIVEYTKKHDAKCDVHGNTNRRGSLGNVLHSTSNRRDSLGSAATGNKLNFGVGSGGVGPRRESMPVLSSINR